MDEETLNKLQLPFTEQDWWPGIDDEGVECIVQVIYPNDIEKNRTWKTKGLVHMDSSLANNKGVNVTLKFHTPP